ncbi:MAG TPA: ATP-dependent DNA helicase UvrD2 [Propionicimonas sp.]|nr:ATP-dependent DNA helicase UvrD2 [Propionicimonas sp.]
MADVDRLLDGLDPEQAEVATTFGVPVGVIAGAGTGKTRAITHRIAYGVGTGAYDPRAVLAVTFTTRAAGELRTRLRGLGVPTVQARTFHSAALRQAQYFWPRATGSALPPVSERRLPLVAEAARRLGLEPDSAQLRDLLTEVSWAKVDNVSPAEYAGIATAAGREVAGLEAAWVGRVLGRYEQVKTERGVIDFDDILLCACALLSEHPDVAAQVRGAYRHLVVDEYQDVSPVQQALLELWRGTSDDLCVVGDPAQTIHSFAGASPEYLTGFTVRFPHARTIRLLRDYRSTPQVVALANQLSRRVGLAGTVRLLSQARPGPEPVLVACDGEEAEAQAVVDWLVRRHEEGVPWRELAVLYRIHAQSPVLEAALAAAGIGFSVRGGDGFYERAEVRQALGALAEAARRDADVPAPDGARGVLARLGWTAQAPAGQGRQRERWESLAALLALADEFGAARPGAGLGALVAELGERASAEHAPASDGVTLSTLHAAKGLEWDGVALVGLHEGTLPLALAATPAQLAEEGRLLYVGVTRAKRHLQLTWSRTRRGGGPRQPSRFLAGIAPGAGGGGGAATTLASPPRRGTALAVHCRVCGGPLATGTERKLERHADCPAGYDEATYAALLAWRAGEAKSRGLPAFCVFTDATLIAIAERSPADLPGLLAVPGVGGAKAGQYATAVLAILTGSQAAKPGR